MAKSYQEVLIEPLALDLTFTHVAFGQAKVLLSLMSGCATQTQNPTTLRPISMKSMHGLYNDSPLYGQNIYIYLISFRDLQIILTDARLETTPYPLSAIHLYDPASFNCILTRFKTEPVAFTNWLVVAPSLVHMMFGNGSPDTSHVSVKFDPIPFRVFLAGSVIILGGTR